jgi:hypothetical protein
MKHLIRLFVIFLISVAAFKNSFAQKQKPSNTDVTDFPSQLAAHITNKINSIQDKIYQQTEKTLKRLQKQELKIKRNLRRKDTALAKTLFDDSPNRYDELVRKLQTNSFHVDPRKAGEYLPNVDSLNVLLKFMKAGSINANGTNETAQALQSINTVQDKLKYVEEIKKYIKNRKNVLGELLSRYGMTAQLKQMNKDVYYYGQYIKEYKSILNEPSKFEKTALQLANKVPAFREFASKNSMLNSLFASTDFASTSGGDGNAATIPGLQTRNEVSQVANTNMISGGSQSQDVLGSQLATIKNELNQLKSNASAWDDNAEMPNFKPNEMRSKSFIDKLEFGANMQFGKSNSFVPSSTDLAAQVGYKFHQNGSFGIGASYKLGFGSLRAVSFSHQGVGLRSFLDYKLKGSFFVNGGAEYNYNASFKNIEQLHDASAWQTSALLGLSKKYKVSKKVKGNLVLLYDFLHKSHTPVTQPFVFRFGYNF